MFRRLICIFIFTSVAILIVGQTTRPVKADEDEGPDDEDFFIIDAERDDALNPTRPPPGPKAEVPLRTNNGTRRGRRRRLKRKRIRTSTNVPLEGLSTSKPRTSPRCTRRRKRAMSRLLSRAQVLGLDNYAPPTTDDEVLEECDRVVRAIKDFRKYSSECFQPIAAQIVRVLLSSLTRVNRGLCKTERNRDEAKDHLQCLRPGTAQPLHDCAHTAALKAQWLASRPIGKFNADYFIPSLCCGIHQMEACMTSRAPRVCAVDSVVSDPKETTEFLKDVLLDTVSEAMDLFCGRYSSVEHCQEHLPDVMDEFDTLERNYYDADEKRKNGTHRGGAPLALPLYIIDIFEREDFTQN